MDDQAAREDFKRSGLGAILNNMPALVGSLGPGQLDALRTIIAVAVTVALTHISKIQE